MKDQREEKKVKQKGIEVFRIIWNIISRLLTVVIIIICLIIGVQKVTNNKESFFGYRIFRVQTGSMIPKYQIGDVILVKEKDANNIKVGDDVTYLGEAASVKGLLITHRVIDIEEKDGKRIFHTKGIANNLEDPAITGNQINGVVQTKLYVLTLICNLLVNKYIFYFCGIVPLSIYAGFRIFKGRHDAEKIERENWWKEKTN